MRPNVIELSGLTKVYRSRKGPVTAVDSVDLSIPQGGVHGYLGANGSGKTTTLRMVLGLTSPTSGDVGVLGARVPDDLPRVIARVGAVLERPMFSPWLTGHQNLTLLAIQAGLQRSDVESALDKVEMSEHGRRRYRGYSLGMRQRLSIAAAIMRRPELVIMDEPSNGLDPVGARLVRDLIRSIAADGATVLLSSHLLSDVQELCETVTVLSKGKVAATGTVSDILSSARSATIVRVTDVPHAVHVLRAAGFSATEQTDSVRVGREHAAAAIAEVLIRAGIAVHEIAPAELPLESAFLELTRSPAKGRE